MSDHITMNSGAVALGKDGKMKEEEKEARELIERIKKLGLNDATIGEMVDEIERLRAKTDGGATVPCSGVLCRLADDFETIANQWEEKMRKQKNEYFTGQYEGMAMAFAACSDRLKQEQARLNRKPA